MQTKKLNQGTSLSSHCLLLSLRCLFCLTSPSSQLLPNMSALARSLRPLTAWALGAALFPSSPWEVQPKMLWSPLSPLPSMLSPSPPGASAAPRNA